MKIKDEGDEGNTKHHQTCFFSHFSGGVPRAGWQNFVWSQKMMIESWCHRTRQTYPSLTYPLLRFFFWLKKVGKPNFDYWILTLKALNPKSIKNCLDLFLWWWFYSRIHHHFSPPFESIFLGTFFHPHRGQATGSLVKLLKPLNHSCTSNNPFDYQWLQGFFHSQSQSTPPATGGPMPPLLASLGWCFVHQADVGKPLADVLVPKIQDEWSRVLGGMGSYDLVKWLFISHKVRPWMENYVVVSSISIFIPTWGRFPFWLYNIFQMGWNHQLETVTQPYWKGDLYTNLPLLLTTYPSHGARSSKIQTAVKKWDDLCHQAKPAARSSWFLLFLPKLIPFAQKHVFEWCATHIYIYIPDAQCMDYLPTLGEKWPHSKGNGLVNIPIPWSIWVYYIYWYYYILRMTINPDLKVRWNSFSNI